MELACARLKKGEGRFFKKGGLWIYDNEIDGISGEYENGGLIALEDFDGYPLGTGYINDRSKIRIRMLSRNSQEAIDEAFWKRRAESAVRYRERIMALDSCRLVFGEADGLPGLVVDKYADVLVLQCLALGMEPMKAQILALLKDALEARGETIRGIYERSDAKERKKEGLPAVTGWLGEAYDTEIEIVENGVRFLVDIAQGQKTGFFLDQKFNRKAIRPMAKDARVLDCFTHTGSFALNAAQAGAKEVLGVDASELAVEQAVRNAGLNGLSDVCSFRTADVFELLPELIEAGEQYDLVILDPPAFTKSRNSVKNAMRGYREINRRGMQLTAPGGFLATCSCSHFMTPELFRQAIEQAARDAHVRIRQVEFKTQAPDHPILWAADESYYLKFYVLQVLKD